MFRPLIEIVKKADMSEQEKQMLRAAVDHLRMQTDHWHTNSPKKVAASIFLRQRNDCIVAQNIGISKVTGTQCAERSALAVALSKYPDLAMQEITDILILGETNPILPCGVCCEWLYKINSDMNLYTMKGEDLLKIKISDYYGDESKIEGRYFKTSQD